jgi:hypothetical protein
MADEPHKPQAPQESITQFWARWAANQGTSTVLVFIGLFLIHEYVPQHLAAIKEGYAELERSHKEERKERDAMFLEEIRKERELLRGTLDKIGRQLSTQ